MNFSDWVNRRRVMLDMDLRAVSDSSNVHFTTVNRIENSKTDPTMDTFIKIILALKSTPAEVYTELTEVSPLLPDPKVKGKFPTKQDVLDFLELKEKDPRQAGEMLASQLNQIHNELLKQNKILASEFISESPFSVEDVFRFLIPPTDEPNNYFLETVIKYPPLPNRDVILQAYLQNAALILDDLKAFLSFPPSAKEEIIPQIKQKYSYHASASILNSLKKRFLELEQVGRTKLSDILTIDKAYSSNGEFFIMACQICSEEIASDSINCDNVRQFILLSRWNYEQ